VGLNERSELEVGGMVVEGSETYDTLEPLAHDAISQQFCATAIGSNGSQAGIGIGSRQSNNILNAKGKDVL
jgi:hypothetical protein